VSYRLQRCAVEAETCARGLAGRGPSYRGLESNFPERASKRGGGGPCEGARRIEKEREPARE
jgi:hypothetical protein